MIGTDSIGRVTGKDVYDPSGEKIGSASEVYLDDQTAQPEWITVRTGLFGTKESFVPIRDAALADDGVYVSVSKNAVKDAPRIDSDGHLSPREEQELYRYYGLDVGTALESPTTTDDAMTRSEERLVTGTRSEEVGRARLRKYVVTDHVTETVPVSREEIRIQREPVTAADDAGSGHAFSEDELEVPLHAERPVVAKEAVPVERVRVEKETATEEEQVGADLRREEVEIEDPRSTDRRS
ncbi:DUF2382 domain-containing protein [Geodermatophilus chilensis]|uniref:DUF2382 domain-containing protein n=1 Tax=Geodermatophilus chilensis TaxID=2035835 RepID=UPI000C260C31|nr:PRC and DUF2382 domain-containing protein [Geodermatophilus chilensis]